MVVFSFMMLIGNVIPVEAKTKIGFAQDKYYEGLWYRPNWEYNDDFGLMLNTPLKKSVKAKVTSSNKKVLTVKVKKAFGGKGRELRYKTTGVGKATLKCTVDVNGKTYKTKRYIMTRYYSNPFTSFMIGEEDQLSKFEDTPNPLNDASRVKVDIKGNKAINFTLKDNYIIKNATITSRIVNGKPSTVNKFNNGDIVNFDDVDQISFQIADKSNPKYVYFVSWRNN